jgi:nitroreductase
VDFFEAVKERRSVRAYESRDVSPADLQKILETVNAAPSAGNLQAYEVVIVTDPAVKDALVEAAYGRHSITDAPVSLVFCADHLRSAGKYGKRGAELYAVQDATIAAAYCQLAATSLGLVTVWIGAFDPAVAAQAINAPENMTPVAIIPIGYAAEHPDPRPRRALPDLTRTNQF